MTLRIEHAAPEEPAWDSFIEGRPDATYAHLHGWRRVFLETFGHQSHGLVARRGGAIDGVLPLVRVRSRLFGDYLMSMPFINYGGPVGSEQARTALSAHAAELAADLGVQLLELRNRLPVDSDLRSSDRKITVVLDLPDDPEVLWKQGLKAKVRSQVRRPMKEGMTAAFGDDLLEDFYSVFTRNMRDLGTPVLPISFFQAIRRHLGKHMVICVVRHQGRPVASGCGFVFGSEFELTWASSLREYNRAAPNMLLYWSLIEEMVTRGISGFNFGRCTPGGGTHRFKLQWGGHDQALPWSQWSPTGLTATPSPDSAKYRAAIAMWQRLPLPVANRLGPLISRSIP